MAIEFGSRKETFENYKVYETMLAGRPFKVEMGKMCGLSNASALIRYGETFTAATRCRRHLYRKYKKQKAGTFAVPALCLNYLRRPRVAIRAR